MSKAVQVHEVPGQAINGTDFQALPSGTGDVVTTTATQTMTNKSLTAAALTGATTIADGATITTPILTWDIQALTAVGSAIGDAGAVTATAPGFVLAAGANNAVGIVLPSGTAAGGMYVVKNNTADILFVYPGVNCTINAIAANTKMNLASLTSAMFVKYNTTAWFTLPLLPS